jgi:hypothetical protein
MDNHALAPRVRLDTTAPSRRRFIIMGLLFVTVVITYLDRSNLSIAAPGSSTPSP